MMGDLPQPLNSLACPSSMFRHPPVGHVLDARYVLYWCCMLSMLTSTDSSPKTGRVVIVEVWVVGNMG